MRVIPATVALLLSLTVSAQDAGAPPVPEAPPEPLPPSLAFMPDVSFTGTAALAAYSATSQDDIARSQAGAEDPRTNGLSLQQLELAIGKELESVFRVDGALALRGGRVEVDEAYASTLSGTLPYRFQARVGKFATRFARLNVVHPHGWELVDQPFALTRLFGPAGNRAVGMELVHTIPLDWGPFVEAKNKPVLEILGSVTDAGTVGATRSFAGAREGFVAQNPLHLQYTLAVLQFLALGNSSVYSGVSVAVGPNRQTDTSLTTLVAGNLQVDHRLAAVPGSTLTLQAEAFLRLRALANDVLWRDWSGVASVAWRSGEHWGAAVRYELGTPARGPGDTFVVDFLDPYWTANRHRASASLTYWPNESTRVRAQLSLDFPRWEHQPLVAVFLTFAFAIGTHRLGVR